MPKNLVDLSSEAAMLRTKMNVQASEGSVTVAHGVVSVAMKPNEVDNATHQSDRRRNELSIKGCGDSFLLAKGEQGTYTLSVKFDDVPEAPVTGGAFYHIVQIKRDCGGTDPVLAISFLGSDLVLYRPGGKSVPVAPARGLAGKWLSVSLAIDNTRKGDVRWACAKAKGTFEADTTGLNDLYLKVGQYRSAKIAAHATSVASFRDIAFTSG